MDKDRIFFPPGRLDAEPFLDVVLDRADSGDIDVVMVHGRVLMEDGRVTAARRGPRTRTCALSSWRPIRRQAAVTFGA